MPWPLHRLTSTTHQHSGSPSCTVLSVNPHQKLYFEHIMHVKFIGMKRQATWEGLARCDAGFPLSPKTPHNKQAWRQMRRYWCFSHDPIWIQGGISPINRYTNHLHTNLICMPLQLLLSEHLNIVGLNVCLPNRLSPVLWDVALATEGIASYWTLCLFLDFCCFCLFHRSWCQLVGCDLRLDHWADYSYLYGHKTTQTSIHMNWIWAF